MKIKADFKESVRSLTSAKQRTLLAVIGITIGIGSVITMVSVGKMVQNEAMKQFSEMGTNLLTVRTQLRGFSLKHYDHIISLPENNSSILQVSPVSSGSGKIVFAGKEIKRVSVKGVSQFYREIEKLQIQKGRFLSELDHKTNFAVIGNQTAKKFQKLSEDSLIGKQFKIDDRLFMIIGILEFAPNMIGRSSQPNKEIFIHAKTTLRLMPRSAINSFKFKVKPGTNHKMVEHEVKQYFSRIKKIPKFDVESPEQLIKQMQKQMELYTLLLGAIAGISLIVGGVGVMNVMLVSITERRKEIGIRRALGARRRNISSQFLIESIVLSILGGFFGIIFGILSAHFASKWWQWEFVLSQSAILIGFVVSSIIGIFFGFYPALQASKLDPIVALRSD